uniref:Uncharacterized protein n=1 Tax=Caenorhabditis japonica TaxID=281687 RepID=A0A8R1IIL2_CAEJA
MVTQWRRHSNALRPLTNAYNRHSSGPSPADALSHRTIAAAGSRGPPPATRARTAALHIQDHTVSRQPINATQPTNQRSPETF